MADHGSPSDDVGTLSGGVFRYRVAVPAKVIDMLGHANNTAYVRWMQDAAVRHSAHLGMPWESYVARGAAFVIRRQTIEYLLPLREGDEIEIATWVVSMSQSASVRKTEIKTLDGRSVLQAETMWIFVSLVDGRPTRIPDDVRAAFERREG
jgi:acyl-CoA thioester hydrolase